MKVLIEFYRIRDRDDAHALLGRVPATRSISNIPNHTPRLAGIAFDFRDSVLRLRVFEAEAWNTGSLQCLQPTWQDTLG